MCMHMELTSLQWGRWVLTQHTYKSNIPRSCSICMSGLWMHWQDFTALNSFSRDPHSLTPVLVGPSEHRRTCLQPCLLDGPWTYVLALSSAAHGWTLRTHPLALPGAVGGPCNHCWDLPIVFGSCGITPWLERAWPVLGPCSVPFMELPCSCCSLRIWNQSPLWLFD